MRSLLMIRFYLGLMSAFIWLEVHFARVYRWAVISQLFQFLVLMFIFAQVPISKSGDSDSSYLPFVLTGLVYQIFYESIMNGPIGRLNEIQLTGQLQVVLSAPFPRWMTLLAAGSAASIFGAVRALIVLLIGMMYFNVELGVQSWFLFVTAILFTVALGECFALLNIAGSILWPRVNLTSFFSSLVLGLLSGVFIPVEKLPALVRPIAMVNPLRWGLDLFRASLDGNTVRFAAEWPWALAMLAVVAGLAIVCYRRADQVLVRENRYQHF